MFIPKQVAGHEPLIGCSSGYQIHVAFSVATVCPCVLRRYICTFSGGTSLAVGIWHRFTFSLHLQV